MPKVSIIVPIYNIEKFLSQCIESICHQTYLDFECLLIDDGSTDHSSSICDYYARIDHRIKAFHKKNGGLTSARNYGLQHSSGDWIMHIDGDDWIEPDSLKRLLQTADNNNADMVIGDFYFAYDDYKMPYKVSEWTENKITSLCDYISSPWTTVWQGIAKHNIYTYNTLESPSEITYCEDSHLMVRLCYYSSKIVNCHYHFYNYRQQNNSIMHNLNKKTEKDEQWAYLDIINFFKSQNTFDALRKPLNWRLLKSTQELVLNPIEHSLFTEICNNIPSKDIWSCPFINNKIKIMAWLLNNHLSIVVILINKIRKIIGR